MPVMAPVSSKSGWVKSVGWQDGEVYVQFKGAICIYSDPEMKHYHGLLAAPSAGSYIHAYLYDAPYRRG